MAANLLQMDAKIDTGYLMSWSKTGREGRACLKERMRECGLRLLDAGHSGDQYRVSGLGLLKGKQFVVDVAINEDAGCLDYLIATTKKHKMCVRALRKGLQNKGSKVFSCPRDYPDELLEVVCGFDGFFRPPQDMYSLGQMVHELLTGNHAMMKYDGDDNDTDADLSNVWRRISKAFLKKEEPICPLLRVFRRTAMERDPEKRLTAHEAFRLLSL